MFKNISTKIKYRKVLRDVEKELGPMFGDDYHFTLDRYINCEFSDAIFLNIGNREKDFQYLLKVIKSSPLNDTVGACRSEPEFNILSYLYPKMENIEGIGVPKPILLLKQHDALVMQAYDKDLLQNETHHLRYKASQKDFKLLGRHYYLCGLWLNKLYKFSQLDTADVSILDSLMGRLEARLEMLMQSGHPYFPSDFADIIRRQLSSYIEELKGESIPLSLQHGDFGGWNILSSADDIIVIDMTGCQNNPICYDFINVLVFLDSQHCNPFRSSNRINEVIDNFIEGYGNCCDAPDKLWHLIEFFHRFRILITAVLRPNHWRFKTVSSSLVKYQVDWFCNTENRVYLQDRVRNV